MNACFSLMTFYGLKNENLMLALMSVEVLNTVKHMQTEKYLVKTKLIYLRVSKLYLRYVPNTFVGLFDVLFVNILQNFVINFRSWHDISPNCSTYKELLNKVLKLIPD